MALSNQEVNSKLLLQTCPYRTNEDYELDGIKPQIILEPNSDQEIANVLALASANNKALATIGGGSKVSYGSPFENIDWLISTKYLTHEPLINTDDLVAIVKAGTSLEDLQNQLNKKGLFLPFDCELSKATVGGTLAFGGGGSHRLIYGMVRDAVLGLKVALIDGKMYRFGGQTVKNVAGYDMAKLFIGSMGTLGVITEASLRVYALPPSSKVILFSVKSADVLSKVIGEISNMEPTVFEIFDYSLAKLLFDLNDSNKESFMVLVKFTGPNPSVDKKTEEISEVIKKHGHRLLNILGREDESDLWKKRIKFFEIDSLLIDTNEIQGEVVGLKISLPPVNMIKLLKSLLEISQNQRLKMYNQYMPTLGIVHSRLEIHNLDILNDIFNIVNSLNGLSIIETGTVTTRKNYYSSSWRDMDMKIKKFFDPNMIMNPGKQP